MLLKYSIKNYRSFHDTATLDMISSSKIRSNQSHEVDLSGVSVLRNAAIYGANAAGKSNLMSAFHFLKVCIQNDRLPLNASLASCKIKSDFLDEDTVFDIMFEKGGRFFDYGFSVALTRKKVTSEWLFELSRPGMNPGSEKTVFSWKEATGFSKETTKPLRGQALERMKIYTNDFLNSSDVTFFLSSMNKGKDIQDEPAFSALRLAYEFITRDLRIVGVEFSESQANLLSDDANLHTVGLLLGSFDTGVTGLARNTTSFKELEESRPKLHKLISTIMEKTGTDDINGIVRSYNDFAEISTDDNGDVSVSEMLIKHAQSDCGFEFREESDGTKRLFDCLDLVLFEHSDAVLIIDEIDRSLHPMITRRLVELFNEHHAEDRAQLVFTTHETSLMGNDLLRRDEIWFIDRREDGSSDLFPLDKFKERSDASIEKAYLKGRYGGIPVLKAFFDETDREGADGSAE